MSRSKGKEVSLAIGGPARADLLPPEIKAGLVARAQRRGLIAVLVLVVVLVGGGYAGASALAQTAQSAVEISNTQTAGVLLEQVQYAEVSQAQSAVAAVEAARKTAMATEIDWRTELAAVIATLPSGAELTSLTVTSSTPLTELALPSSPLEGGRVAELALTVETGDILDTADWIQDLSTLEGFVDATPTAVSSDAGVITTVVTLHLNSAVYWNRFVETEPSE